MNDVLLGVTLPQFSDDPELLVGGARRAEALELNSVWVFDHLWPLSGGKTRPIFEAWTAVAWLAVETTSIGIGSLVTRSSLRHPTVLAKTVATVADSAPGRLTVGIGSGDELSRAENEAFGIPYRAEGDRIDQLSSTVQIVQAYLGGEAVTHKDEYVAIDGLPPSPKPSPKPSVWVAGRSDDALDIAGRFADGWNGWGGTPARYAQDALRVAEFATAAGRDAVELTWGGLVILGEDDLQAHEKLGRRKPDDYVVGGPDTVARHLGAIVDAGARHLIVTFPDAGEEGVYEIFATKVKAALGLR